MQDITCRRQIEEGGSVKEKVKLNVRKDLEQLERKKKKKRLVQEKHGSTRSKALIIENYSLCSE